MRLTEQLAISGLAAWALVSIGLPALGVALGLASIMYHGCVYATGARLLHPPPPATADAMDEPARPERILLTALLTAHASVQ